MDEMNQAYREFARDIIEASPTSCIDEFVDYIHILLGAPQTSDATVER